ncbi:MAG: hypothetical protein HOO96_39875 [Polyangiaceae bacterium]|nr:hypothetical protein [Polyangiaceae bacterium]
MKSPPQLLLETSPLNAQMRAFVGLSMAHAWACPACIVAFTEAALATGVTLDEIDEIARLARTIGESPPTPRGEGRGRHRHACSSE